MAARVRQPAVGATVTNPFTATTPPAPAAGGTGTTGTNSNTADARRIIAETLGKYFTPAQVAQLLPVLMGELTAGEQIVAERVMSMVRDTNVYRERFAGLEARRQNGLPAINENEYLALERTYRQMMSAAGMPAGFYDTPSDFANLIGSDVSPAEFSQRVQEGYRQMANAPADVKEQMRLLYGVTDGEMAAYFIDPNVALPLIETQVATSRLGASAARAGVDAVGRAQLERLARMGVNTQQADQGFARIAADSTELYRPLNAGEDEIDVQTGIDATFTGDAAAQQRIRQRRQRRGAEFQQGGAYATAGSQQVGLTNA